MGGGKGGGGGGGTQESTVYQSSLPPYAEPFYTRMMERGEAVTDLPYETFGQERISGFQPETLAAQQGIVDLASRGVPGIDQAIGYTDFATQRSFSAGDYQPNEITAAPASGQLNFNNVSPDGQVSAPIFDQAAVDQYTSPYIDNVIESQKSDAIQDFDRQRVVRQGQAAQADAYGGSRHGVVDYLAEENLNDSLQEIEERGLQFAFDQAQQQFERDRTSTQRSEMFGLEQGLQAQLANQQADLGSQEFGVSALMDQQGRNEENRQQALQLGLAGDELAMRGAGQVGNLEYNARQGALLDQYRNLAAVGQDYQNLEQSGLDLAYQDFINQRDFERQNVGYLSGILQGVPVSPQSEILYNQGGNSASQLLGLGLGGLGLYQAFQ